MTDILLLFNAAGLSAAFLLALAVYQRSLDYLWLFLNGAILGTAALAYSFEWAGAGYVLATVSVFFIITPLTLTGLARSMVRRNRRDIGFRLYKLAILLHPTPAWRLMGAMEEAAQAPDLTTHGEQLNRIIASFPPHLTAMARLMRFRLRNDWEGILAFTVPAGERQVEPLHRMLSIRALGESGRLNDMVEMFLKNHGMLSDALMVNLTLLTVVQFTGRTNALPFLMALPDTATFSKDQRAWVVNATQLVAGETEARARLQELTDQAQDLETRRLWQERLDKPYADPAIALRPELAAALDDFIARSMIRVADLQGKRQRFTPVTLALIAANALFFAAELFKGNPESTQTLFVLGGLWPPTVMRGEWWRLGSALFLHAGWAHLILNMAMLYALGQSYERRNGSWRMLLLYGFGGLISMATVFWLMWLNYIKMAVLVGASGAIFALFSGQIVDMVGRWRKTGMTEDRNALFFVALCLLLQVAFDNIIPGVSFAAHVSGFVAGLLIGVILNLSRR